MRRYVQNTFMTQYKATIGADFLSTELDCGGKPLIVQIWDTAGQEKFQSVQGVFYKGADACMLVFDLTNPRSFQALGKWKSEFLYQANPSRTAFPFVLVGNKEDLENERQVTKEEALQWCKENGEIPYYEASAKTATKVKEAFVDLANKAIANKGEKM
eukprot:TRINITY_DN3033_c0_g1_i10.p2 TRINITY_DN3033_c0_g1~~TRINITY_DN3033_c0_g1_i10.p2  ORF type:complete len:158 (-),score=42.19 TRINITY_DN3033_c0_g1_i10:174-647(-)